MLFLNKCDDTLYFINNNNLHDVIDIIFLSTNILEELENNLSNNYMILEESIDRNHSYMVSGKITSHNSKSYKDFIHESIINILNQCSTLFNVDNNYYFYDIDTTLSVDSPISFAIELIPKFIFNDIKDPIKQLKDKLKGTRFEEPFERLCSELKKCSK